MLTRLFEPNIVYVTIRGFFRLFFRVMGTWRIVGLEHIPPEGPVIIISNHISYLDPPLMGSAVRRTVAYMGKAELFTGNRLLAWVCRKLESYPVRQGTADREALRTTFEILERGWMVGIFPEGHRSETGELQPFQPGLGLIALRSRAPVVPCGFAGTYEMLRPHSKRLRRSHIEVHFGQPLKLDDLYEMQDKKQAAALVNERAYAEVKRLVEEAKAAREQWYARRGRKMP